MHRILLPLFAILMATYGVNAADEPPFIEYQPGTLPLILAAPHGGNLRPADVPNRSFGRVAQDSNTAEITLALAAQLEGVAP